MDGLAYAAPPVLKRDCGALALPGPFQDWFARRGWRLRSHQAAMIDAALARCDALLIAPTGGGKTLGGFLPSLVELAGPGAAQGCTRSMSHRSRR